MTPLPDRVVIAGLVLSLALCFGLAFWAARHAPQAPPLQWRETPAPRSGGPLI
jgi:hypothetical protein